MTLYGISCQIPIQNDQYRSADILATWMTKKIELILKIALLLLTFQSTVGICHFWTSQDAIHIQPIWELYKWHRKYEIFGFKILLKYDPLWGICQDGTFSQHWGALNLELIPAAPWFSKYGRRMRFWEFTRRHCRQHGYICCCSLLLVDPDIVSNLYWNMRWL